jgi:hypothetical protein
MSSIKELSSHILEIAEQEEEFRLSHPLVD